MGRGWIADVAMLEVYLVTEKSDRGELVIWYSVIMSRYEQHRLRMYRAKSTGLSGTTWSQIKRL
jgi:hypothetical protein